ncbi:3-methyl-2-oxobutanoate hydroxymethyltransferase [Deinococcus peraridilitoris]|uniref:3-methyl-2-oxobutanoate hydroxymethyltransferase n=1 Tax=Deinococcus peraridilitoris (strain DSM 19664 / LMG 22246 / CIP 109416 / KR-200) TaxID=937777 RepID=K9ZZ09_DEIPD|nr:3-methyl-2-oxobutanoate hydroxymethyltransferase [Deinococcus peraridilitoris DSM 19664]
MKKTVPDLVRSEDKLVMVTAYDYPGALSAERAGVDMILVGDSLGNVVLGLESTAQVTLDDMIHHARAVRRGAPATFLVVDMPFGSFQTGVTDAARSAVRLVKETGADAVKLEGGEEVLEITAHLTRFGIPVMGHVGLRPQTASAQGGLKVQGKTVEGARMVLEGARAAERAGAFAVVLEAIPNRLAALVTERLRVPTIGIGAGPHCRGQVLVYHDLLGLYEGDEKKLAKRYAELGRDGREAITAFAQEVRAGVFPTPEHGFLINSDVLRRLQESLEQAGTAQRVAELDDLGDAERLEKLY